MFLHAKIKMNGRQCFLETIRAYFWLTALKPALKYTFGHGKGNFRIQVHI